MGKNYSKKPYVIERYNAYMNAVGKSDQIFSKCNILRNCVKWWKRLFFHMIDVSIVNIFYSENIRKVIQS